MNVAETNSSDPDLTAVIERLAPKFHHTHCRFGDDECDYGDSEEPAWPSNGKTSRIAESETMKAMYMDGWSYIRGGWDGS